MEAQEKNYEIEEDVQETQEVEASQEDDIEIDDTPEEDRGKKHLGDVDIPEDEISQYSSNVQKRINQLKRAYHDERRDKEKFLREQQEAINYAQAVAEQNKALQEKLSKGESVLLESHKNRVSSRMAQAEKKNIKMPTRQESQKKCLKHRRTLQDFLLSKEK